jgi:hypothetical protein
MNQQSREILWNVPLALKIFLYAMVIPLTVALIYECRRWYRMVILGQPSPGQSVDRLDQPGRLLWLLVRGTARRDNMVRETWGWMHNAFCVGFPGLCIGTTIIFFNDGFAETA